MAEDTKIEWADHTANLWMGCTKVSPGCDLCYAELLCGARLNQDWGPHADRKYVKAGWELIRKMQRRAAKNGGIDPRLGRQCRIFVNSLADFFDNHKSIVWRGEACDLMDACPDVIFMLVTKRPENVRKMVPQHWLDGGWPKNVWLLVTVEDQKRAEQRLPVLASIPAPVRGASFEPLLERLELDLLRDGQFLNWAIVGGESGKGARDNDFLANAEDLYWQCLRYEIPFFGKQGVKKVPLTGALATREFPE
jgi:protein gp37